MTTEIDPLRLVNATIYKQSDIDAAVLAERERCASAAGDCQSLTVKAIASAIRGTK